MVGSGIKKLAKENNLKVSSGVAYGNLHGYASTFSEGSGYKRLVIATSFPDPEAERQLTTDVLNGIAYDEAAGRIFITGKKWPKIYQIELIKQ